MIVWIVSWSFFFCQILQHYLCWRNEWWFRVIFFSVCVIMCVWTYATFASWVTSNGRWFLGTFMEYVYRKMYGFAYICTFCVLLYASLFISWSISWSESLHLPLYFVSFLVSVHLSLLILFVYVAGNLPKQLGCVNTCTYGVAIVEVPACIEGFLIY